MTSAMTIGKQSRSTLDRVALLDLEPRIAVMADLRRLNRILQSFCAAIRGIAVLLPRKVSLISAE